MCSRPSTKISYRNSHKITLERLFELDKKFYLISVLMEGVQQEGATRPGKGDDGDQGDDEDEAQDHYLDDEQEMEIDKSNKPVVRVLYPGYHKLPVMAQQPEHK
jgi:hypothetical protein